MAFIKTAYLNNGTLLASAAKLNLLPRVVGTYDGVGAVTLDLGTSGASAGTYSAFVVDTYGRVTSGLNLSVTGDVTGTAANGSIALTLGTTGVSLGTYNNVVVDTKGRVTSASLISYVLASALGANSGVATLDGSGKLTTSQIPSSLVGAVVYQGVWNASTNTPTLTSSTGTKGFYYKVSVAGSTALDGITQWNVGDTAIYNGTTWDKIDGIASEVLSVNGSTGAVTITNITGNAGTATALQTARSIALSGDATGSVNFDGTANVSIATTLATVATPGTFTAVTFNAKGLVTTGANMTATGDATGTASGTSIALTLATVATAGTYSAVTVNAKGLVTAGANLSATGDATGTASGNSIALTLASSGVTAGTYNSVVVNTKGIVTSGSFTSNVPTRRAVTAATYTVAAGDTYIGVNFAGAVNITIPLGSTEGRTLTIKDESGAAFTNNITITATSTDVIDGAATTVLNVNNESLTLYYSGSKFWII